MSKTDNLMNFLKNVIPAFRFVVPASELFDHLVL